MSFGCGMSPAALCGVRCATARDHLTPTVGGRGGTLVPVVGGHRRLVFAYKTPAPRLCLAGADHALPFSYSGCSSSVLHGALVFK